MKKHVISYGFNGSFSRAELYRFTDGVKEVIGTLTNTGLLSAAKQAEILAKALGDSLAKGGN